MPPAASPLVVAVYGVDLDPPAATAAALVATLPESERTASEPVGVARAAARILLAGELGIDPTAVVIDRRCARCGHATHGRPIVAGAPELAFSVTHSGRVGLVAIARTRVALGVDVEVVALRPRLDALAARVLDDDAFTRWQSLDADARLRAFLEAWTAKEAYLKATGVGITTSLRDVPAAPAGWTVCALATPPGSVGALATEHPNVRVEMRQWEPAISASGGTAR